MEAKINLEKLNEKDWEKYRKMDKVARRTKGISASAVFSIFVFLMVVALLITTVVFPLNTVAHLNKLANYSFNQFNTSISSSQIKLSNNITSTIFLSNATVNTLITTLTSNPKASSALSIYSYLSEGEFIYMVGILMCLVIILFIFGVLFFGSTETIRLPHTYKQLQMCKNIIKGRTTNLTKFGFSQEDTDWYYAVRSELIKLKIDSIL